MVLTKQTEHKYQTKEEEEMAKRMMEEAAEESQEAGTVEESQEAGMAEESQETGTAEESQDEPAKKKRKKDKKSKDKKPKSGVKSMMKEERQKKFEELKAERKAKALEKKKAKEEAEKEKARLKREEHKMLLEKTHALIQRHAPVAAARSATATATSAEIHPAPPRTEHPEDPLETLLVEPGPLLVSLNPFEGEGDPVIRPTLGVHPGAAAVLTETIHVESSTERPLEAMGGAPKKSTGGKAPQKQAIPKKNRKTPGSGALRYIPEAKHIREARKAGGLYPDDPHKGKKNHFWPGYLALNEIRHYQKSKSSYSQITLPTPCLGNCTGLQLRAPFQISNPHGSPRSQ